MKPSCQTRVYAGAVPSLSELVRAHTYLTEVAIDWLPRLMADCQLRARLSLAELVLWLPGVSRQGLWAGSQMRPTTGPPAYGADVVATSVPVRRRHLLDRAWSEGRLMRDGDPELRDNVPVRVEAIPVRRNGAVIAVVARNTNLQGIRTPSRLELSYLQTAGELTQMISEGTFPSPTARGDHADSPRVGDGFLRLTPGGQVSYASPNALSLYRRLGHHGDLDGLSLADVTRALVPVTRRGDEETLSAILGGRADRDSEVATDDVAVVFRSIALTRGGEHLGAVILVRDVTDLRRRDRELVTKDATIREIHHRVKNNLQTVAALLRLQARRIDEPAAREALQEAVRRVGSIALVHDTLSHSLEGVVDFDEIADRLGDMVTDVSSTGAHVRVVRRGAFGNLRSETATALAMVLTEILQNGVEHGFAEGDEGSIEITARRERGRLLVDVLDDGRGLPAHFDPDQSASLGLSIIKTLVESELAGTFRIGSAKPGRGVLVELVLTAT